MVETGKINLAIFASGSGTNAENIANYFKDHHRIRISLILSNKPDAYVLERANKMGIPAQTFTRQEFREESFLERLKATDYIILAGFLWLIPEYLIHAFREKIINIHPALLPDFGGKGMYGHHVHEAVINSGKKESGITIHLVNQEYDKGKHLFQAKCEVLDTDTPDSLAYKVNELEYKHFPEVIENYIMIT